MNIVFFGTPDFVIPIAETLKEHFTLVAAVTTPDRPAGRKNIITAPPIKTWALENTIQVVQPEQFNNVTIQELSSLSPDLFVVASYGKILPQAVLDIPQLGAINIHPSRLPHLRGVTPVPTSILEGITESAVSIIKMDDKMDHGPIITSIPLRIAQTETAQDVLDKAFNLAANSLPSTIQQFSNVTISPVEQDHTKATFCKKLSKQDGYIDLGTPPTPEQLDRMVRAYYPWPGTWTKVQIANGQWRIVKFLPHGYVQVEGKNKIKKEDFFSGYPEMREQIQKLYNS